MPRPSSKDLKQQHFTNTKYANRQLKQYQLLFDIPKSAKRSGQVTPQENILFLEKENPPTQIIDVNTLLPLMRYRASRQRGNHINITGCFLLILAASLLATPAAASQQSPIEFTLHLERIQNQYIKTLPPFDSSLLGHTIERLKPMARKDDAEAQYVLSKKLRLSYVRTAHGAEYTGNTNVPEAKQWLISAARNGNPNAIFELGLEFLDGQPEVAYQFFRQVAHVFPQARFNFAYMSLIGKGTEQDIYLGLEHLGALFHAGYPPAVNLFELLDIDLIYMNKGVLPVGVLADEKHKTNYKPTEKTSGTYERFTSGPYKIPAVAIAGVGIFHFIEWAYAKYDQVKDRLNKRDKKKRDEAWKSSLDALTKDIIKSESWLIGPQQATLTVAFGEPMDIGHLVLEDVSHPAAAPFSSFKKTLSRNQFLVILDNVLGGKLPGLVINRAAHRIELICMMEGGAWDIDQCARLNKDIISAISASLLESKEYKQYKFRIQKFKEEEKSTKKSQGQEVRVKKNGHKSNGHLSAQKPVSNGHIRPSHVALEKSSQFLEHDSSGEVVSSAENTSLASSTDSSDRSDGVNDLDTIPINHSLSHTTSIHEIEDKNVQQIIASDGVIDLDVEKIKSSQALINDILNNSASPSLLPFPTTNGIGNSATMVWNKLLNFANCISKEAGIIEGSKGEPYEIEVAWHGMIYSLAMLSIHLSECAEHPQLSKLLNCDFITTTQATMWKVIYCYFNTTSNEKTFSAGWMLGFGNVVHNTLFLEGRASPLEDCGKLVDNLFKYSGRVLHALNHTPRLQYIVDIKATYLSPPLLKHAIEYEFAFIQALTAKLMHCNPANQYRYYNAFVGSCIAMSGYYFHLMPHVVWEPIFADLAKASHTERNITLSRFTLINWMQLFSEISYLNGVKCNNIDLYQLYHLDNTLKDSIVTNIAKQFTSIQSQLLELFMRCVPYQPMNVVQENKSRAPKGRP